MPPAGFKVLTYKEELRIQADRLVQQGKGKNPEALIRQAIVIGLAAIEAFPVVDGKK